MDLRQFFLRGMLWSLGFAAAMGVLALAFSGGNVVWRVVGTGAVTAIACGLLMPASAMIDRQASRAAGLVGMGAIIVEYALVLAVMWELADVVSFGVRTDESLALTAVFWAMLIPPAMGFSRLMKSSLAALAGRVGLILSVVVFGLLMIGAWGSVGARWILWEGRERWWATATAVAAFGLLSVMALVGVGMGDRRYWRWAGVPASAAAGALWLGEIWLGRGSEVGEVLFAALTGLAVVVAHANLVLLCPLRPGQRWMRSGTIAAVIVAAVLIDLIVINDLYDWQIHRLGRLAAAGGIVASCGTLALVVLMRLNRNVEYEPVTADIREITVWCPRCGKRQQVLLGEGKCSACSLRINVRIEEPRCPTCGYLLYRLTSDRCPECGTSISAAAPG